MKFRTACAWCGVTIKEDECSNKIASMAIKPEPKVFISHGICPGCKKCDQGLAFAPKPGFKNTPHLSLGVPIHFDI